MTTPPDARQIAEWLALFVADGRGIEIRAPKAMLRGVDHPVNVVKRFLPSEVEKGAREAHKLSGTAPAVYFVLNGIKPELVRRTSHRGASATDVTQRYWLLIDCDPTRPADCSATDAEKVEARKLMEAVRDHLDSEGWPEPIEADSGNGYHLVYRIDLPCEDDGLVKRVLESLAARFDTPASKIDRKVYDPSRLVKLYGTKSCKGENTAERPHRYSCVLQVPDEIGVVPVESLQVLAAANATLSLDLEAEIERKQAQAAQGPRASGKPSGNRPNAETRALAYLAKCDPAVAGQGGHDQTFKTAVAIGPGFGLDPETAFRILLSDYNPRCVPPWSERELRHKVDEAYKKETRRGWLLDAERERPGRNETRRPGGNSTEQDAAASESDGRNETLDREHEADPGRVNEAPDDPSLLARQFIERQCQRPDGLTLRFFQEGFIEWDTAYHEVQAGDVRARLHAAIKAEFDRQNREALERWTGVDKEGKAIPRPTARKVTNSLVSNTVLALSGYTRLGPRTVQPSWLGEPVPFPAEDVLPTRNALVYLPGLVAESAGAIHPPTPRFFCPYALDYDFDPAAPRPDRWLAFLASLWPDDPAMIAALQEWFGHLLTPDTTYQKILMLIGPKRSGKGTIARVIKALIGTENVANPTFAGLGTNFGLAPLIGKPAAIITDARLSGRTDIAQVVERLLSISGEDSQTIDRKHLPAVTVKLPTRFTVISNELPRLLDTSGALAGRLILLSLTRSFYGHEDRNLTAALLAELPGILLWAIEGWRRLRERGRFEQPPAGQALVTEMEDLASPVGAFLKERCEVKPGLEVAANDLYLAWAQWCEASGRRRVGTVQEFGRDLRAVMPGLTTQYPRSGGDRRRSYQGLDLKATVGSGADY